MTFPLSVHTGEIITMKTLATIITLSVLIITSSFSQSFDLFGGAGLKSNDGSSPIQIGEEIGGTLHFNLLDDIVQISPTVKYEKKSLNASYAGVSVPISLNMNIDSEESENTLSIDAGFYLDTVIDGVGESIMSNIFDELDFGYTIGADLTVNSVIFSVKYSSGLKAVSYYKNRGLSFTVGLKLFGEE